MVAVVDIYAGCNKACLSVRVWVLACVLKSYTTQQHQLTPNTYLLPTQYKLIAPISIQIIVSDNNSINRFRLIHPKKPKAMSNGKYSTSAPSKFPYP